MKHLFDDCIIYYQILYQQMIPSIWEKEVPLKIQLAKVDVCDWIDPLPLFLNAKWNHYIGFYLPQIYDFFLPFLPHPQLHQTLTLTLPKYNLTLSGAEIVSHLFSFYSENYTEPLIFECSLRQKDPIAPIDLKKHFKQNLKASTCIRYGKFGAKAITVDMSVTNIDDMYNNFFNNLFQDYLGDIEQESTHLGYKFIVQNEQIENVPVRIVGRGWRMQRSVKKGRTLADLWLELGGGKEGLCLHGVRLKNMEIEIEHLETFGHPDGFLYFTF